MEKTFKLQKSHLLGLAMWLGEQQLAARPSRFRSKFLKDLGAEIQQFDEDRITLAKSAAEKDEEGNAKTEGVDNEKHFVVAPEHQDALNTSVAELMSEEFVIVIDASNKEKMDAIRDILLNTPYVFGPREGDTEVEKMKHLRESTDYNIWCEAFEEAESAPEAVDEI